MQVSGRPHESLLQGVHEIAAQILRRTTIFTPMFIENVVMAVRILLIFIFCRHFSFPRLRSQIVPLAVYKSAFQADLGFGCCPRSKNLPACGDFANVG